MKEDLKKEIIENNERKEKLELEINNIDKNMYSSRFEFIHLIIIGLVLLIFWPFLFVIIKEPSSFFKILNLFLVALLYVIYSRSNTNRRLEEKWLTEKIEKQAELKKIGIINSIDEDLLLELEKLNYELDEKILEQKDEIVIKNKEEVIEQKIEEKQEELKEEEKELDLIVKKETIDENLKEDKPKQTIKKIAKPIVSMSIMYSVPFLIPKAAVLLGATGIVSPVLVGGIIGISSVIRKKRFVKKMKKKLTTKFNIPEKNNLVKEKTIKKTKKKIFQKKLSFFLLRRRLLRIKKNKRKRSVYVNNINYVKQKDKNKKMILRLNR